MKRVMALMALTILTACDYSARKDIRGERDDRLYRAAMDDYRAGRMDVAIEGFEKAVRNDPANASARFQLACLQQDVKKDFLSAYCGYREFLLQHPGSDRANLARDRMVVCEKEMAHVLASKHGFNEAGGAEKALADARAEIKLLTTRVAAAEKNLGSSQARVRALSSERDRLLAAVKGLDADRPESSDLQSVLQEKSLMDQEDVAETGARQALLTEKRLLEEDEGDEVSTGSSLIPVRKPADLVKREAETLEVKPKEAKGPAHPKTYVVEEGDTLYGIAKKFYGSFQAWKTIREANKTIISSDYRLRAGDTLVLP